MFNKTILAGNLGAAPEIRSLQDGKIVATIRLATSSYGKDRNGNRKEYTEWHTVILWGASAKFAQKRLQKGSTVVVDGYLRTRKWEDKEGITRYSTEVVANSIQGLARLMDNSNGPDTAGDSSHNDSDEDVPF